MSKKYSNKEANFEKAKVIFYSGYKENEAPRSILIEGREHAIEKIIWRKRFLDAKSKKMIEVFRCQVQGKIIRIERSESGEWKVFPPLKP